MKISAVQKSKKVSHDLTDEEKRRTEKFAQECLEKVEQIVAVFSQDTRGMMQFMYTMSLLSQRYPALMRNDDAPARVADWMTAGEPENLDGIADKIMERVLGRPN